MSEEKEDLGEFKVSGPIWTYSVEWEWVEVSKWKYRWLRICWFFKKMFRHD